MIKNIISFFDRTRQHSQLSVPHIDGEEEYQTEVRGLQQQVYEFWVTAATASGEGEMSAVVSRKPNTKGERIFNVSLKCGYFMWIFKSTGFKYFRDKYGFEN